MSRSQSIFRGGGGGRADVVVKRSPGEDGEDISEDMSGTPARGARPTNRAEDASATQQARRAACRVPVG